MARRTGPGQEPPRRQAVPAARDRLPAVSAAGTLRPARRRDPQDGLTAHSSLNLNLLSCRRRPRPDGTGSLWSPSWSTRRGGSPRVRTRGRSDGGGRSPGSCSSCSNARSAEVASSKVTWRPHPGTRPPIRWRRSPAVRAGAAGPGGRQVVPAARRMLGRPPVTIVLPESETARVDLVLGRRG
jgi:hypothetical protein